MKKIFTLLVASLISVSSYAQIVINEIDFVNNTVEIKNIGNATVEVGSYQLCSKPSYKSLGMLTKISGSTSLAAGEFLVVTLSWSLSENDGELALYTSSSFSSSTAIVDFLQWGNNHTNGRQNVAVQAQIWTNGEFISGIGAGDFLEYDGSGDVMSDYSVVKTSSLGSENSNITGLFENNATSLEVYPNPVVSTLNFDGEMKSVVVINTQGIVVTIENNTSTVDFSSVPSGIYTVEMIDNNNNSYFSKVVK